MLKVVTGKPCLGMITLLERKKNERSIRVTIRISELELEMVRHCANLDCRSVSDFVRHYALHSARNLKCVDDADNAFRTAGVPQ